MDDCNIDTQSTMVSFISALDSFVKLLKKKRTQQEKNRGELKNKQETCEQQIVNINKKLENIVEYKQKGDEAKAKHKKKIQNEEAVKLQLSQKELELSQIIQQIRQIDIDELQETQKALEDNISTIKDRLTNISKLKKKKNLNREEQK
jgi:chromosome segregation ATPase